jgi:hypothetical protein
MRQPVHVAVQTLLQSLIERWYRRAGGRASRALCQELILATWGYDALTDLLHDYPVDEAPLENGWGTPEIGRPEEWLHAHRAWLCSTDLTEALAQTPAVLRSLVASILRHHQWDVDLWFSQDPQSPLLLRFGHGFYHHSPIARAAAQALLMTTRCPLTCAAMGTGYEGRCQIGPAQARVQGTAGKDLATPSVRWQLRPVLLRAHEDLWMDQAYAQLEARLHAERLAQVMQAPFPESGRSRL